MAIFLVIDTPTGADLEDYPLVNVKTLEVNEGIEVGGLEVIDENGFVKALKILFETVTAATYTFALTDSGIFKHFTNTSAVVTVPNNTDVAFPVGTVIGIYNASINPVVIQAASGVTINSFDGILTLAGQYADAYLRKIETNTWVLSGVLAPA